MSSTGIEFQLPTRNSKFAVKDMSNNTRYEYWVYCIDPVTVRNGMSEIQTTINYRFSGNQLADVFSGVVKTNNTIDYDIKPDNYKLRPSSSFKTLTLNCYAITKQEVKIPPSQPIAKIVLY